MDNTDSVVSGNDHRALREKDSKDAYEADEGLQTLRVVEEEHLHLDAATSIRLRRRADMLIMPVSICLYDSYPPSVA